MAKWWESSKKDGTEEEDIKLPKEIQEQLDQVKTLNETVRSQGERLSKLDSIETMLQDMNKPKPKPAPTKTAEDEQAEREEISALLLTDPEAAYARLASRTNAGVQQLAATIARKEVFDEQADKFPYYTGDVKAEVNKILSAQPLAFQTNHQAIENTYYTVIGRMKKEIDEGKIKDRFASSTATNRGSGLQENENDKTKITSNDDIRKIARQLGMKEEDYIKLLEEDAERYV